MLAKRLYRMGLAVAAVGLVARGVASRRELLQRVAPELRHPLLYLPLQISHRAPRTLVCTLGARASTQPPVGVTCREVTLPGQAGEPDVPAFLYETEQLQSLGSTPRVLRSLEPDRRRGSTAARRWDAHAIG